MEFHISRWTREFTGSQWLRLRAFTSEDPGLIPIWETLILQAVRLGQKKKKKKDQIVITTLNMAIYLTFSEFE